MDLEPYLAARARLVERALAARFPPARTRLRPPVILRDLIQMLAFVVIVFVRQPSLHRRAPPLDATAIVLCLGVPNR